MRRVLFLTTLLMMILTATAFAEDTAAENDAPYVYTSEDFKFTITCPIKPLAVVENPWQEPEKRGEMLVFANEGFDIQYAYVIQVNAFENDSVPDFNKADKATIDEYLKNLREINGFGLAELVSLTKTNKGVYAVTAETIEVKNNETGEVEGEFVADRQDIYTYFRTPEGRCIGIQLINVNMTKELIDTYRYSVAGFKDNTEVKKSDKKDKKTKEKKEKKSKKDKK